MRRRWQIHPPMICRHCTHCNQGQSPLIARCCCLMCWGWSPWPTLCCRDFDSLKAQVILPVSSYSNRPRTLKCAIKGQHRIIFFFFSFSLFLSYLSSRLLRSSGRPPREASGSSGLPHLLHGLQHRCGCAGYCREKTYAVGIKPKAGQNEMISFMYFFKQCFCKKKCAKKIFATFFTTAHPDTLQK